MRHRVHWIERCLETGIKVDKYGNTTTHGYFCIDDKQGFTRDCDVRGIR